MDACFEVSELISCLNCEATILMANDKGPTEGGSGGKRGHSNMEHWMYTEEVKDSTRVQRRKNDKAESERGIKEYDEHRDSQE